MNVSEKLKKTKFSLLHRYRRRKVNCGLLLPFYFFLEELFILEALIFSTTLRLSLDRRAKASL